MRPARLASLLALASVAATAGFTAALAGAGCTGPNRNGRVGDPGEEDDGGVVGSKHDGMVARLCDPAEPPGCEGDVVRRCNLSGTGYDYAPCPDGVGCTNGVCNCAPGKTSCNGQNVMLCDKSGVLHLDHTCPNGTQCKNGVCDDQRCEDETMSTNPHALPTNAWPRYRHDNRNTGYTQTIVADMPKLKWKVQVHGGMLNNDGLGSAPVINQNNIVFQGAGNTDGGQGSFYAYDKTGALLYKFPANRGFGSSTPAVRLDGTAYFSSQDSNLYAVDPKGAQLWNFKTGSQADSDPIVTKDGILVYSSDDGSVYALDGGGKLIWKSDPTQGPGEVDGGLAESCDGQIYAGGRNGWLAMNAKTGATIWKVPSTGATQSILASPVVTADGTMYGFDSGGQGIAIDSKGNILWKKVIGPSTAFGGASAGLAAGTLYTLLNDGNVYAVDAKTGNVKWKQPAGAAAREINAAPIIDGKQRIYYGGNDGFVYSWDDKGTLLWKIPTSGKANPSMDLTGTCAIGNDGTLYVPANDGWLYAFQ